MTKPDITLSSLESFFPSDFSAEERTRAKTLFYKELSFLMHQRYGGKMQVLPKVPLPDFNWYNVWYTPGVSKISTAIRDDNDLSFSLSGRGNSVAVVSDSTRVLGDGDCTPAGGLGVMEGKAFLMKMLGGIDALPLCIDSRDAGGKKSAERIIEFVKMVAPSFGAVNLEDISQPNCYLALDALREECSIPVWHDDAQGTAAVTLAGLINSFKLAEKDIRSAKIVLFGAGASNSTVARLLIAYGADPGKIILFDQKGSLNANRVDYRDTPGFARQWDLCQNTNRMMSTTVEDALSGADALVAFSSPGPDTVKPQWISSMAHRSIVFACANPVPEIYPYRAKEAGAFIVATGRGDFPNQVNNSLCFPGLLKGTLLCRASKITDGMAIKAAESIARYSEKKGVTPERIIADMNDASLYPVLAADTAVAALEEGVAQNPISWEDAFRRTEEDIAHAKESCRALIDAGMIQPPPIEYIEQALEKAVAGVRNTI